MLQTMLKYMWNLLVGRLWLIWGGGGMEVRVDVM